MAEESSADTRSDPQPASRAWQWTAWEEWAGWRGPPELVAQIARAALWAVSEEIPPAREARCSISLHVGRDVERFDDPTEFREHVTADGLRRFSWLDVELRRGADEVRVRLSRFNVSMGRPGVVLLATAGEPGRAERMRETVAASIERRTGRSRGLTGEREGAWPLLIDLIDHPSHAPDRSRPRGAIGGLLPREVDGDVTPGGCNGRWRRCSTRSPEPSGRRMVVPHRRPCDGSAARPRHS